MGIIREEIKGTKILNEIESSNLVNDFIISSIDFFPGITINILKDIT